MTIATPASTRRRSAGEAPPRARACSLLAGATGLALALTACSSAAPGTGAADTTGASNTGSNTGTATGSNTDTVTGTGTPAPGSASAPVTVAGAPAALSALVTRLYAGGDLGKAASPTASAALAKRRPASGRVQATAKTGSWLGTPVAVVTAGDDVTLAVGPTWKVVGGWWPSLDRATPSLGPAGPRWVLAIGSDARKGQALENTRADVLQVIGTDGQGGGGVMGMARDLWVPLSTGGKGKINSAMVFGGPKAQQQTVARATGLPLEGYVVLGFSGFTTIIDEQGGIPMVVPETVDASHADLVITKGAQTLSGKQALAYARERKTLPDGDFGRSRHQGQIILAAGIKAKLAGPQAIPSALTSFSKVGQSNLSAGQMLTYVARLYSLNPMQVGRGVAKGGFGTASGQSIVVLGAEARRLFASFRDGRL